MRLDLASFRELEAFTQFGSDLDAATQAKLNRGHRTVEILKQGLHETIAVEKQVMILYALTHGFIDTVPVSELGRFEAQFYDFLDNQHNEILEEIVETKDLPRTEKLDAVINEFITNFFTNYIDSSADANSEQTN